MDEGRLKIDPVNFLTSLLINVIVFSLAFVYITHGPTAAKPQEPVQPDDMGGIPDGTIEPVVEISELPMPVDFFEGEVPEELGEGVPDQKEIDAPQFQWEFDSNFLQYPHRGKTFWIFIELDLDHKGNLITEPEIETSSGEDEIDAETIRRLKKLKFTPALDKVTGEPIPAKVPVWIVWYPGGG